MAISNERWTAAAEAAVRELWVGAVPPGATRTTTIALSVGTDKATRRVQVAGTPPGSRTDPAAATRELLARLTSLVFALHEEKDEDTRRQLLEVFAENPSRTLLSLSVPPTERETEIVQKVLDGLVSTLPRKAVRGGVKVVRAT